MATVERPHPFVLCMPWLGSVCYALASFTLWRLAASAHNVSLYWVRQHKDVQRGRDREEMIEREG